MFTYEDDTTIPLFKEPGRRSSTSRPARPPPSTACPAPARPSYPDKLRTELLGGAGPDVWRIWGGQIGGPFAKAKQALDLAPYYEKFGWDNTINTTAIEGMTFDGVKAGVPFISLGMGAWYNKAMFDEGRDQRAADQLRRTGGGQRQSSSPPASRRLATGGKYGWHIMRLFEYLLETAAGPELHDKLLVGEESWDRPEVVTAFTNFKKCGQKWIPEGALGLDPSDIEPTYVQGKTAYTITGPWTEAQAIQTAKKDEADFGVFQLPTGHATARHSGFVEGYMINAKSGNVDKAAELVNDIVQPDTQKAMKISALDRERRRAGPKARRLWAVLRVGRKMNRASSLLTVQDQAFPKQSSPTEYLAAQSELLQGKVDPAGRGQADAGGGLRLGQAEEA